MKAFFKQLVKLVHFGPIIALSITFFCYSVALIDSILWLKPVLGPYYGALNMGILTATVSLLLRNFFRSILGGPGFAPKGWSPLDDGDKKYLQYCRICQGYKPPRAHHCRHCKKCVLKMDHHCPWINNCVGHYNHTNFVLFVFFAPLCCLHAFIIYCVVLWYQLLYKIDYLRYTVNPVGFSVNALLMNFFAMGLAFGTIAAVGFLFYQQLRSVFLNQTGVEQWIVEKALDRERSESEGAFVYPYDLGRKENIAQVLNWQFSPVGDGYTWPVADGCDQFTLTVEQLKQKKLKNARLVLFNVTREYSGCWVTLMHGCRTCICLPCTDEPRIAIKPGQQIVVSRGTKNWLYGDKVLSTQSVREGKRERGWFPRNCVERDDSLDCNSKTKSKDD